MAEVSRIVRERLRTQATAGWSAGEHPDANLLSAFAERTLTEQEQAQVLDHLSRCADCRQVVALSAPLPVEEERQVAAAVAGRASAAASRSWWRSPVVHWGALTAAALVVLIAVSERMRLREGHSASAPAIATLSSNEAAQRSTIPAPEVSPSPTEQRETRKVAQTTGRKPTGAGSGGKVTAGNEVATPAVAANRAAAAPPPPAAPLKESPPATSTGGAVVAGPGVENRIDRLQARAVPTPPAAADGSVKVTAEAAPILKSEGAALSQGQGATFAKRAILSPRWSVSDSGAVQRSFDGGRSWKDVAVADSVSFRAVATLGNEVWAGGSSGALFHSTDGGEHWARVRVQANGRALSGDIVRIEFTDTADGVVVTSTGETWTTSDAGVTWQR
jgi:hypothetical protein